MQRRLVCSRGPAEFLITGHKHSLIEFRPLSGRRRTDSCRNAMVLKHTFQWNTDHSRECSRYDNVILSPLLHPARVTNRIIGLTSVIWPHVFFSSKSCFSCSHRNCFGINRQCTNIYCITEFLYFGIVIPCSFCHVFALYLYM